MLPYSQFAIELEKRLRQSPQAGKTKVTGELELFIGETGEDDQFTAANSYTLTSLSHRVAFGKYFLSFDKWGFTLQYLGLFPLKGLSVLGPGSHGKSITILVDRNRPTTPEHRAFAETVYRNTDSDVRHTLDIWKENSCHLQVSYFSDIDCFEDFADHLEKWWSMNIGPFVLDTSKIQTGNTKLLTPFNFPKDKEKQYGQFLSDYYAEFTTRVRERITGGVKIVDRPDIPFP